MQANLHTPDGPPNPIKEGLRSIGDLYSDYTLVCGDREFKVHRLILHLYSPIFRTALSGPWKEGTPDSRRLPILDAEPDAVKAMLDWFYNFTYDVPEVQSKLLFHLKVYKLGDKYDVHGLEAASLRHLAIECEGDKWRSTELVDALGFLEEAPGMNGYGAAKKMLMAAVKANMQRLSKCKEFLELLREHLELMAEILEMMRVSAEAGNTGGQDGSGDGPGGATGALGAGFVPRSLLATGSRGGGSGGRGGRGGGRGGRG